MKLGKLRMRKLRAVVIHPGDVVVIQAPESMTVEQAQGVDQAFYANGIRCVIVGGGLRVEAVKPAPEELASGFPGGRYADAAEAESLDAEGYTLAHNA